jgi:radical SAM protein with 4Fe4S-binding SPASM domain
MYRKHGNFKRVINAIKLLIEEKKKRGLSVPLVNLQFIVMRHNEHELPLIRQLASELGVDELSIKAVSIMDVFANEDIKKYLPTDLRYAKYTMDKEKVKTKLAVRNMCDFLWEETTINWDGSVVPCCNDAHAQHIFGNILHEDFDRIWNNQKYVAFRKQVLTNKGVIPLCKNCTGSNKAEKVMSY